MNPWTYAVVFAGSVVASLVLVRVSIRLGHRLGMLDEPDGGRKVQSQAIPKLGGIAVAVALTVILSVATAVLWQWEAIPLLLAVMAPGIGMAFLGFLDDRRHLDPWLRLTSQAGLALLAWFMGTRISVTSSAVADAVVFVIWVVAIVNAINMLDNSDGLAGATTLVVAASCGVIAMLLGQVLVAALAWALAGVAAGFLWHNWYPAKVYLGDAGSYLLGYLLAILAVRLRPVDMPLPLALTMIVLLLGLPLADLFFVVTRRLSRGVHPFTAGRDHLSHELQGRELSVPGSVLALQGFLVVTCLGAIGIAAFG